MPETAPAAVREDQQEAIDRCAKIFVPWAPFWRLVLSGAIALATMGVGVFCWVDARSRETNIQQDRDIRILEQRMAEISTLRDDLKSMLVEQKTVNRQLLDLLVGLRRRTSKPEADGE